MFTILLDSSNTSLTVGLAKDDVLLEEISYEAWQSQSEHMVPELDKLLNKYGVDIKAIKEVVVAIGPGSYTGVRIAITIAKTIATVLDVKVYDLFQFTVEKDKDFKEEILKIYDKLNREKQYTLYMVAKGLI